MRTTVIAFTMVTMVFTAGHLFSQKLPDRRVGFGASVGEMFGGASVAYALTQQFHLGAWMGLEVGSIEGNSDVNIFFSPYGKYLFARVATAAVMYGIGQFFIGSVSRGVVGSQTDAGIGFGLGLQSFLNSTVSLYVQSLLFRAHFGDVTAFYFGPGQFQIGVEFFLPR